MNLEESWRTLVSHLPIRVHSLKLTYAIQMTFSISSRFSVYLPYKLTTRRRAKKKNLVAEIHWLKLFQNELFQSVV